MLSVVYYWTVNVYTPPVIELKARYWLKIAIFAYLTCIRSPLLQWSPLEYCHNVWYGKTRMVRLPDSGEKVEKFRR